MSAVNLLVQGVRPVRAGRDYFWQKLLEASRDGGSATVKELLGVCDPGHDGALRSFLARMYDAGHVERLDDRPPYRFRISKPQRDCPLISSEGKPSQRGRAQQQMWNVMRRARLGFTVEQLVIDASTDDVIVGYETARAYIRLLVRAGVVKISRDAQNTKDKVFVLTGSGNTGSKALRRMRAAFMYDPNTCTVLGEVVAEEECP
ncbi:Hypothetical protein NGAL_HAMBI1145_09510 [Neorhizobium galegae bv. officinalis]|uniref:Uncharacterized protein n=1 Tax=Neorhizobium galegae bv. officinalis TaxID=323656 RepID=A0A0T7FAW9_NEOGA|nr:hypothetical protein [Neorhizobium galegae]CDZ32180.1 Hypothetical protein NGAL_HAMBI1145_09510 [Neorhizobium galegae bv. officinalis]